MQTLMTFKEDSSLKEDFIERVIEFKENRYYGSRIMFVEIVAVLCRHFAHDVTEIEPFLAPLAQLSDDPVSNVRIALARAISGNLSIYGKFGFYFCLDYS